MGRPDLLLASEYLGGLVGLVLLGSGRPSVDHLLHHVASAPETLFGWVDPIHTICDRFHQYAVPYERYAPTALRIGLGANFVYLGVVEKLLAPGQALGVVEGYGFGALAPIDPGLWVVGAGLTELALGLALLVGVFTRAAAVTALSVFTLTLFALPNDPVLAHTSLFGIAISLVIAGSGPLAFDARHRSTESTESGEAAPTISERRARAEDDAGRARS